MVALASRQDDAGDLQRLYERHKVLTYPRTDSRALPEDYPETMKETLSHLQKLELITPLPGRF